MRTTFAVVEGKPVQVISPSLHIGLPAVDLRHLASKQEEMVKLVIIEEAQQPFDLAAGPLLRVKLHCLGKNEFMPLVTMHHVISDEWSVGIFVRELASLYDAFATNRPVSLPDLPIQYADFALWQQEWPQTGALDKQLAGQLEAAAWRKPARAGTACRPPAPSCSDFSWRT